MRRTLTTLGLIGVIAFAISGCELLGSTDLIVGEWQLTSENGDAPIFVTEIVFADSNNTFTHSGESGDVYVYRRR